MMDVRWTIRAAAVLLLGAALAGCERQPAAVPVEPDPWEELGPGIHPVLVVDGKDEQGTRVELHFRRVQVTEAVASWQGELRYAAGRMSLAGAELPAGVTGAWNEVEPGRIRFAGIALAGAGDGAVLTFRFKPTGEITADAFTLAMEEVVATEGFANLTARVVKQPAHPLFSAAPLTAVR